MIHSLASSSRKVDVAMNLDWNVSDPSSCKVLQNRVETNLNCDTLVCTLGRESFGPKTRKSYSRINLLGTSPKIDHVTP